MQISVIIPTYNRAHTLAAAIDSVLAQTHVAAQIIVVDDASSDATDALLHQYPMIEVIHLAQNQGVSAARNAGLMQADSEWIALLDSDDVWMPEKLARQAQAAQREPDMRIFHTQEQWVRNGRRVNAMNKHAKPDGWVYSQSLALCCVSPSSILLHKSVFDECGAFDLELPACEDYDLWLRIFSLYPLRLIDEPLLIKHGGHEDQLSRRYWGMDRFRIVALQKMLESGSLSEEHTGLTRKMLLHKCTLMINGAEKRGKQQRAQYYRDLAAPYADGVDGSDNDA